MTKTCADNNLFVWPNGWCSYYDLSQGFDACYTLGLCGVCEDAAMKHSVFAVLLVAALFLVIDV